MRTSRDFFLLLRAAQTQKVPALSLAETAHFGRAMERL
jgi:hypothetical protein